MWKTDGKTNFLVDCQMFSDERHVLFTNIHKILKVKHGKLIYFTNIHNNLKGKQSK